MKRREREMRRGRDRELAGRYAHHHNSQIAKLYYT